MKGAGAVKDGGPVEAEPVNGADTSTTPLVLCPYFGEVLNAMTKEFLGGMPSKDASINYGGHPLPGKLYLGPAHFDEFYLRFFDISPTSEPGLSDKSWEPWLLLHHTQGRSWVHAGNMLVERPERTTGKEIEFVAFVDSKRTFADVFHLGDFNLNGASQDSSARSFAHKLNDTVIAIPTQQRLLVPRSVNGQLRSTSRRFSRTISLRSAEHICIHVAMPRCCCPPETIL